MEISSVNNTVLQNTEKKLTEKLVDEKVTPQHGGGVYVPPKEKELSDSVTISAAGEKALNDDQTTAFHGGGVYVPPKGQK